MTNDTLSTAINHIILAGPEETVFSSITSLLETPMARVCFADSGEQVLLNFDHEETTLLIIDDDLQDMSARRLIETVIMKNPMIHCVVISALNRDDFHDRYEGLGVLMQFSKTPSKDDVKALMEQIERICRLQASVRQGPG